MIIKGASVFCEDGTFQVKDVFVEDHKIVATEAEVSDKTVVDANGYKLIPGLVDVHSHGACGHDFCDCDVEGVKEILRFEKAHGITSYCPTSMTLSKEMLVDIFATAKEADGIADGARVIGINMEGPFLDEAKKGAHQACYLRPASAAFFDACQKAASGAIRLVTVAPNIADNIDFIRDYHEKVTISLGHTSCDCATAEKAITAGADHLTHLFNAMPSLLHREPGLIGAAMDAEDIYAELIADGIHVHGTMIRNAFRMFPDHICLISDSIRGTGLSDGSYELGGQIFHVKGKLATLDDGTIAGSVTNLYDSMCHAIEIGVPMEEAIAAATIHPAKSLGIYDQVGSITPGKYADILLVNKKMELQRVL